MHFDPKDPSTYPYIRIFCVILGLTLTLYCFHFFLMMPDTTPEQVMKHIAALAVGTILLIGTIWV